MIKPLIYLASPYSSERTDVIENRVRKVQGATAKLIEQGNLIFSPIVHSHPICDLVHFSPINTAEAMTGWTQYDHDFIDNCAEVWVLMIDGYDTSRGVSDEIAYAYANNIPVRFVSYPELVVSAQTYSAFNPYDFADHQGKTMYGFRDAGHVRVKEAPTCYDQADGFADIEGKLKADNLLSLFEIIADEALPLDTLILADFTRPERPYRTDLRINQGVYSRKEYTNEEAESLLRRIFGEDEAFTFANTILGHAADEDTKFGAGKFYSPPSSGLPPAPAVDQHTCLGTPSCRLCYPPTEREAFYCHDCGADITKSSAHDCDRYPQAEKVTSLPEDSDERNSYPMAEGLLYYFPNALAEVSRWSQIGNDKHNPGEAMHWARGKSTDHANKIIRHLVDAGKKDADGNRHSVGLAWRALALLQVELENELGLPLPKNAK